MDTHEVLVMTKEGQRLKVAQGGFGLGNTRFYRPLIVLRVRPRKGLRDA